MMEQSNVIWPGWEVVRKIGSGSFGAVYEIRRDVFGREERAALKVLSIPESPEEVEELYAEGYDEASITTHYKEHLGEIVREYSLMLDMKGHTNVVYCDDLKYVPHDDGVGWDIFIKMELLTPLMKAVGNEYSEAQTVRLGIDMCNALILCKQENIVHRDIKPQNMFVSKTGDYKLGDFGVAKVSEKTASGTKVGTFEYMAPEVYRGQPYGSGADLYSLGMVLYWMMNQKRTPFLPLPPQIPSATAKEEARNRRFQGEALPEPANGSQELKRIVLKACAYDPKDRYASAADMQADLKKLDTGAAFIPPVAVAPATVEAVPDEGTVNIFGGTASGSFKLGTDAFEEKTEYIPRDSAEEKTEYIREERTVYIPRQTDVAVEEPEKKKKKKKKGILPIILAIVAVIVVILLLLKSCGGEAKPSGTEGQQSSAGEQAGGDETEDSGTEKIEVPDVTGKDKDTAKEMLEDAGFEVTFTEEHSSEDSGKVIRQEPEAGAERELGSSVTVCVSLGKQEVSVSLDPCGGKVDQQTLTVCVADEYGQLPTPTRDGYTFVGWFTQKEEGDQVLETSLVENDSDHTLYARWSTDAYKVTFDANGGSVDPASKTVEYGTAYGTLPTPEKKGYGFAGWYTAKDGGDKVTEDTKLEKAKDVTLYARWSANAVTVSFNANGGSVGTASGSVEYGGKYGSLPTPTRSGYTFSGWYTKASGGEKVTADTKVTDSAKHTLYAQWQVNSYTVTFDANGGTVSTSTVDVSYGSTYSSMPTPTRTGFTFTGWYTAASGGTKVTTSTEMTSTKDHTLYAQWKVNSYTVKWNTATGCTITVKRTASPNGGASTGTLSSGATVYYGDKLTVTYAASTGYTLSTKGATSVTVTGNVTSSNIYATATVNSYTYNIVYKSSNGTALGTATATYKYGTTNTVSPKSISGYTAPAAQTVAWDSTSAKTITFTYTPTAVSTSQTIVSGKTWWSYDGQARITYAVKVEYRNRTANSVQVRVTWTNTIQSGYYYGYKQVGKVNIGGQTTGNMTIATNSTFAKGHSSNIASVTSDWITVSLSTTNATTLAVSGSWYDALNLSGSFSGGVFYIPAY